MVGRLTATFAGLVAVAVMGFGVADLRGEGEGDSRTVDVVVEAEMWQFTPKVIRAKVGDRVRLEMRTKDMPHGFELRSHDVSVLALPGRAAHAEFVVDRAGGFEFYCTFDCGRPHGLMTGMLVVDER